jgi:hypothetical protein
MSKLTLLEYQEMVDILAANGHTEIVQALYHEADSGTKVYTKRGRLNKSGACRAMDCKPKELEDKLRKCRVLLGPDWVD